MSMDERSRLKTGALVVVFVALQYSNAKSSSSMIHNFFAAFDLAFS
jgi:hypothetical protein